jgi:ABC-type dipeptide/oligopeptide/nickel transport system permease component
MAMLMITAFLVVIGNLLADIALVIVDPRVRAV